MATTALNIQHVQDGAIRAVFMEVPSINNTQSWGSKQIFGAELDVTYNGSAVIPASNSRGLAITTNYGASGNTNEVDFWNIVESTVDTNGGFAFYQKTGAATAKLITQLFTDGTTYSDLEVISPSGSAASFSVTSGVDLTITTNEPLIVFTAAPVQIEKTLKIGAFTFATLPSSTVGTLAYVSDSNTNVWGANIAGGGANKVLAFYNGTNWTVAGK